MGQKISLVLNLQSMWVQTAVQYNFYFRDPASPWIHGELFLYDAGSYTMLDCTIVGFIDEENGKFPSADFERKVIMGDFRNYLTKLYDATTFSNADEIDQGWKDYILTNPSSSFANILVGTLPG